MDRREVLRLAMGAAIACAADPMSAVAEPGIPIIDSHIHLFDTTRPGGVPWPTRADKAIYKPALPGRYERIARPLGVVGAIAIEASPFQTDNDWVLNQAADNPIIVGVVGDLIPGSASYGTQLERLRANPLFVGIRYGNLWDRDLFADMEKPGFVADLKKLAANGLELDSANPDPRLIKALVKLSDRIPDLRIVIDHLPGASEPAAADAHQEYWSDLKRLSQNPRIFIKLSEIPARVANRVPLDVSFYKAKLDAIWDAFGEERILYGSDWPNSDHLATYAETLGLVRDYVSPKGQAASEKFFWKNSIAAYRWRSRQADQPAA